MPNSISSGRLLGWIYAMFMAAVLLSATFFSDGFASQSSAAVVGGVFIFITLGFLLARHYHDQSLVFLLLFKFGNLQTGNASLEDRCLINASITFLLGCLFLYIGI